MKTTDTKNPKIKFGEGDIFDVEAWGFDALAIVMNQEIPQHRPPLKLPCDFHEYLRQHKHVPTIVYGLDRRKEPMLELRQVKPCIKEMLGHLLLVNAKRIGVFGSQISDGTFVEGARETYEAVKEWVEEHGDAIDCITLVDLNGDYNQFLEE